MSKEINEEYYNFQQVFDGEREPKAENAFEQFVKAFKDGNVELALKIYDENNLDKVMLSNPVGPGSFNTDEPLLQTLIRHTFENDQNQIEILTKIIKNPKNESVNLRRSCGADGVFNTNSLMAAIECNIPSIISAILSRDDIDVYAEETIYDDEKQEWCKSTAFMDALKMAEQGEVEPLVILLESRKINVFDHLGDNGDAIVQDYLINSKAKILDALHKKREKMVPRTPSMLEELEKKAKTAAGVKKPTEPKKPVLFGRKKYETEMKEFERKSREYMSARKDLSNYEDAKIQAEIEWKAYEAWCENASALFRVIDNATKEPLKVSSKPREV